MADHFRTALRNAIETTLMDLPLTENRVFKNRISPLQSSDLPGITITILEPDIVPVTIHLPKLLDRNINIVVRGYVKQTERTLDVLDEVGRDVEVAMASGVTVGTTAIVYPVLRSVEITEEQADKVIGMIEMVFDLQVSTLANAPESMV